jgi:spermidine synthase
LARNELSGLNRGAFEDPRVRVVTEDAAAYVAAPGHAGRFDLISTDRPDPIGPGVSLYSGGFYAACKAALSERGILMLQSGVPIYQPQELSDDARALRGVFEQSGFLFAAVPTYVGGFMALGWAARWPFGPGAGPAELPAGEIEARFARSGIATRYYWPGIHAACFAGPRAAMEAFRGAAR